MMQTNDKYQAQDDAQHLTRVAEIHADPKRHKAAVAYMAKTATDAKDAHKDARKELEKRTKKKLKQVFAEGSAKEEASEPKAEAKSEGD